MPTMSQDWSLQAQNLAYSLIKSKVIYIVDDFDKAQLLRTVASWSELQSKCFVNASPRQQASRLCAELPGPALNYKAGMVLVSLATTTCQERVIRSQRCCRIFIASQRGGAAPPSKPKGQTQGSPRHRQGPQQAQHHGKVNVTGSQCFARSNRSFELFVAPFTGWLFQDDLQAYWPNVTRAHVGRKRKQKRAEDAAAMHTSTTTLPAMGADSAAGQAQWVSTYTVDATTSKLVCMQHELASDAQILLITQSREFASLI